MTKAYLGLGSNIGERIGYIEDALSEIKNIKNTNVVKVSSVYETEPWGNVDQDDYLNSVIEIDTGLDAQNLLNELKLIEKKIGRTENQRWAQREIDIDLLFYGNEILESEFMTVPHPQIEKRKFVLVPMSELNADFIHPVFKKTISQLLSETKDELNVTKYKTIKI